MISMAEVKLRAARDTWEQAKKAWQQSLADVNVAKQEWEQAQSEFYGDRNAMTSAAGCGNCTGCATGIGKVSLKSGIL